MAGFALTTHGRFWGDRWGDGPRCGASKWLMQPLIPIRPTNY